MTDILVVLLDVCHIYGNHYPIRMILRTITDNYGFGVIRLATVSYGTSYMYVLNVM